MATSPRELAEQELAWRKCFRPDLGLIRWRDHPVEKADALADAFIYWCLTYAVIFVKDAGDPIPFTLWDIGTGSQKRAAREFLHNRLVIILKTRQLGLSWLLCAYTLWRVMRDGNAHCFFQSIGKVEVGEQVERMAFIYSHLPDWMQTRNPMGGGTGSNRLKDNDSLKQFRNGSAIHAKATTKRAGHGAAPTLYGLDEFARNEQDKMTMRAVKPSLGNQGQCIIISTADGPGNVFADMWLEAVTGKSGYKALFFPASDHPDYTPEFLAAERLDYAGDEVGFMEAYPMTWEEAFQSSLRCPFDANRIADMRRLIAEQKIEPEMGRLREKDGKVVFEADRKGPLAVWRHPILADPEKKIRAHSYCCGADVATGLLDGDYSAAAVLDENPNELCALYRYKIRVESYGYQLELLSRYYNEAWLVVEVNKNADIIISDLKQTYNHRLYCRERRERIFDLPTLEPGFWTSDKTRHKLIADLRTEFHSADRPLLVYSPTVLAEMSTFEENDKGKLEASGTNHDDTVLAVGLAIQGRKTQPVFDLAPPERNYDWRSL